jgi:L-threonine kinase
MTIARCPGTCGELIQGVFNQTPSLVSAPIDWFSEIEVSTRRFASPMNLKPKMAYAARSVCHAFDIELAHLLKLNISHRSSLPIAKGFASSTADIIATIVALTAHFGAVMPPEAINTLASSIEPSDASALPYCALFDHINGRVIQDYPWQPSCNILILESASQLDTVSAHQSLNWQSHHNSHQQDFDLLLNRFNKAISEQNLARLGEATSMSAEIHQHLLPKPLLFELLDQVVPDIYGINIAHTGTIIGLLYDAQRIDINSVLSRVDQRQLQHHYPLRHYHQLHFYGSELIDR